MGIIRLMGTRKDTEDIKPSVESQRGIAKALRLLSKMCSELKEDSNPTNKQLIELYDQALVITQYAMKNAVSLKTVASREFRTSQSRLPNLIVSIQEIISEGSFTKRTAIMFKQKLREEIETVHELFLSYWSIDLSDRLLIKALPKIPYVTKEKTELLEVKSKRAIKVESFSELSNVMKEKNLLKKMDVEEASDSDEAPKKKKRNSQLDFSDSDSLVLSKYKSYAKQFAYNDDDEVGMCIMSAIPLIAISKPTFLNPEVLEEVGIRIENLSGYSVFPNQLVVGIKVSAKDSVESASSQQVKDYILSTVLTIKNRRCVILGKPKYLNDMLCFWIVDEHVERSIRKKYPRFMINDWTTCFIIS